MLALQVEPGQHDVFDEVVDALRQQLRVERANAAADDFNVNGQRQAELGSDDDGA